MGAGAEDGAELCAEHFLVGEGVADGAESQEGVAFGGFFLSLGVFVGAEVDGADGECLSIEHLYALGVGVEVVFFCGGCLSGEVEELGAIEPDALASFVEELVDFFGELDVSEEFDFYAIGGDCGEFGEFVERETRLFGDGDAFFVDFDGFIIGIEDDGAFVAVDDDGLAVVGAGGEVFGADDCGQGEGAGDDGGVGGSASEVGDEPGDVVAVEACGLGRGEVAGDDDGVLGDLGEGGGGLALEFGEEAGGEVAEVVDLGLEGGVGVFGEAVGKSFEGFACGELGGEVIVLDHRADGVEDGGVVEGADVEEEDFGSFEPHLAGGFFVEGVEVGDGGSSGEFEAFELGGSVFWSDALLGDAEGAVVFEYEDAPDDESFGNRDA